jgi:hypothetical protein
VKFPFFEWMFFLAKLLDGRSPWGVLGDPLYDDRRSNDEDGETGDRQQIGRPIGINSLWMLSEIDLERIGLAEPRYLRLSSPGLADSCSIPVAYRQRPGSVDSPMLASRGRLTYHYEVSTPFSRQHSNPPLFSDRHWHCFRVTLFLETSQYSGDLYGCDMIEIENLLKEAVSKLPQCLNDLPGYESGTTEAICCYFGRIQDLLSDPLCRLVKISVSETSDRVCTLVL